MDEIQNLLNGNAIKFDNKSNIYGVTILNKKKSIKFLNATEYVNLLNKYQSYFNFEKYDLIPNFYGKFKKSNELKDYHEIPNDIIEGINKVFKKDLYELSTYNGIKFNCIEKITFLDIGKILEQCFEGMRERKKKEFNYNETYYICKIIIKYIPKKSNKEYQTKLYNLYKLIDKISDKPIEIDSYDILYIDINKGIKQYINESLNKYGTVDEANKNINDIYKVINENFDILDPDEYSIIPNQLGIFKKISELRKGKDLIPELVDILSNYTDIKSILIDNKIKKFEPEKIIENKEIEKTIYKLIENNKLDIKLILELIPKENNEKQKDIKCIYQNLFLKGKELNEKAIDLGQSFLEKINEKALEKFISFFANHKKLKDINENEEEAFHILELLYKYIKPQVEDELNIVPNQNGIFCSYKYLYNEKEFNKNFKETLKNYFHYDISDILIHKKLRLKASKDLAINEDIIKKIKNSFSDNFGNIENIIKAKKLMSFYPKDESEKGKNTVKQFIQCYKIISGEEIKEEEIDTTNISLWEKPIKILLNEILAMLDKDCSINKTAERIGKRENEIISFLNDFYKIFFHYTEDVKNINYKFIPNEKCIYKKLDEIYINKDKEIDKDIRDILSTLDEQQSYDNLLIHKEIDLSKHHKEKTLEDIAKVIDTIIKEKYKSIDFMIENSINSQQNSDNVKNACKKLLQEWFPKNEEKMKYFSFTRTHITEICFKILDEFSDLRKQFENQLLKNPEKFKDFNFNNINNKQSNENNPKEPNEYNKPNEPNNTPNQMNQNNDNNNCNAPNPINSNDKVITITLINNNETKLDYFLCQGYVYENLISSNLFNQIDWINKANENEEGECIMLINQNKYKVKNSKYPFDFIVTTNQNNQYFIRVKMVTEESHFLFYNSYDWDLFKKPDFHLILAFVILRENNNPEIYYTRKDELNQLI